MKKAIVGKKIGMTQLFDKTGKVIPVTVVEAGPCVVVQKKTLDNDGYESVQLGFGEITEKHLTKALKGHFAKADVAAKKYLREFRLDDCSAVNVGDIVKADAFEAGEKVDVTAKSKGHGYAGTIQRYGFGRLRETHGSGPVVRHIGSMGNCSYPGRVVKGKKLPGHMGVVRTTVQNLEIVKIDEENNLIAIKGAIPGPKGAIVSVMSCVKKQKIKNTTAQTISKNPQKKSARG